jgi:queuosine precursor transporter
VTTERRAVPTREGYSQWFVVVVAIFITCLITANITAVKLVSILGLILPAGVIVFPISYIVGDVLTEVYGFRMARQVIWLGFICNLIAVLAIWLAGIMPSGLL